MKTVKNRIEFFFLNNTSWIFITAIFFISFNWSLTRYHPEIGVIVYLALEKWELYLHFSSLLLLLFSPVLAISIFRVRLSKDNPSLFRILWLYSFIIHPFLLTAFEVQSFFEVFTFPSEILLFIGILLTSLELLIIANQYFKRKTAIINWIQEMSLEKVILVLITIGAFLTALLGTFLIAREGNNRYYFGISLLLHFSQVLLFLLLIYTYYWLNHYFLVKKLLKKKGIFYYVVGFVALGLIFYPLYGLCIHYFRLVSVGYITGPELWIPKGERLTPFSFVDLYLPWLWMVMSIPFILVYQWWKQKNEITQLQKEKSETELNALKQQINPHFLFNTLNSLYALGIEEKSEKTADGIAQLGTLMRYNLHDAQVDQITLTKEIGYIQKYLELQALRLTDKNKLTVQIDETRMEEKTIAPMLLIPFIENAFKYGVSPSEATRLDLKISLKNSTLVMQVYNTVIGNRQQKNGNGIGISNTRQRLAKLYPEKYELIIEETAKEFEVHLEIDIGHND